MKSIIYVRIKCIGKIGKINFEWKKGKILGTAYERKGYIMKGTEQKVNLEIRIEPISF